MNDLILQVTEQNGDLVVDSRLIAIRLDIEHESFMRTIKKYESKIEQRFGIIRFEIGEIKGKGQPEKFAFLTEDQATALMTFSKNTDAVVDCKMDLVEAFSKARQIIKTVIPKQQEHIIELQLRLELAQAERDSAIAQKTLLDKREAINQFHNETTSALILGAQVVDRVEYRDRTIASDGHVYDGVGISYLQRRYGFRNTAEAWKALESVGLGKENDQAWKPELTAVTNLKLSPEYIAELDRLFVRMTRQKLIGENGLF